MSTSEATYGDWANLPNDILYTISSMLLHIRDYIAFNKVCTSWMAARAPPSKIPYLLYFSKPDDNSEQSKQPTLSTDLSNINEYFSLNGLHSPYPHGKWQCIGSQDGWLIITVENRDVVLFNPLTAQQINLPNINFEFYISKAVIMWPCQTDDELIVILFTGDLTKPIAFARISDKKWYYRSKNNHPWYEDICCIDRKAFLLGRYGGVYAINLNKSSYRVVEIIFKCSSLASAEASYMFTDAKYSGSKDSPGHSRFMVKYGKDILCISTYCRGNNFVSFLICKYDMEKQTMTLLKDLGGCSLFVGESCSILVSAEENIGRKGNVIYFQNWYGWMYNKVMIGVFDMEDGSYKTIKLSDSRPGWPRPKWFTPSYFSTILKTTDGLK